MVVSFVHFIAGHSEWGISLAYSDTILVSFKYNMLKSVFSNVQIKTQRYNMMKLLIKNDMFVWNVEGKMWLLYI